MDARENHNGQAPEPKPVAVAPAAPTFMLKRFAWGAPDRLEVSGTFGGLHDAPADASPMLIISTGERIHRLPAVPDSVVGPLEEGRLWRAAFAWQDAPVAFEVAELQIGADVVVRLPEPGATRRLSRPRALEVRNDGGVGDGAERVGSKIDLLAAQEQVLEVAAALQQTQEELTRARNDLSAERERHAEDRERFREGLATVQGSAEEALALEQSATQQLGSDLREAQDALDANDTALEDLRGKLEATVTAQTQRESNAQAEIDALREHVATLERAGAEADQLRSELEQTRTQADNAQAGLEAARSAVSEARTDAERLLGRLTAIPK